MLKIKVYFITGNKGKLNEAKAILEDENIIVENIDIDVDEIQSTHVDEVICKKLKTSFSKLPEVEKNNNVHIFCEDTGLGFDNMNGFPGALIKFYLGKLGNEKICEFNGGSNVRAQTVVGYTNDGQNIELFSGNAEGIVPDKPLEGERCFGWDPIFVPKINDQDLMEYNGMSYAQMPVEVKNRISARGEAFRKFKEFLLSNN